MFIYTLDCDDYLSRNVIGFNEFYEDPQEDIVGFKLKNKSIEINRSFAELLSSEELSNLLNSFVSSSESNYFNALSTVKSFVSISLDPKNIIKIHDTKDSSVFLKERENASRYIEMAREIVEKNISLSDEKILISSSISDCFSNLMNSINPDSYINNDPVSINKQDEEFHSREIFYNGNKVGHIDYLEDNEKVVIIYSSVDDEYQNKGIGFSAYQDLIREKLRLGKSVGSDSILTVQSQKIYSKLSDAGYSIAKNETRLLYQNKVTTLSREEQSEQLNSFPTVYCDGARVTDRGYRYKGDSVFMISPPPSLDPVIAEVDLNSNNRIEYKLSREGLNIVFNKDPDSIFSKEDIQEIKDLFLMAKNELSHKENESLSSLLDNFNVTSWSEFLINRDSLCNESEPSFSNEF